MRTKLVMGNWKMNGSSIMMAELLGVLSKLPENPKVEYAVCPPYVYLAAAYAEVNGSAIKLGAQDVSRYASGAYTGEVAASMLKEVGCQYVLIGHSERRQYHAETNAMVAEKFKQARAAGLMPVVCIGETLAERQAEHTERVVAEQLDAVLAVATQEDLHAMVIAYEPVWAIGTGLAATPQQVQAVHAFIRARVAGISKNVAENLKILYGGSVKADNAAGLFALADVDGGLIGGASLKADEFTLICRAAG